MSVAAPDDFVTRRKISATADVAAQSSDEANGSAKMFGCG